MIIGAALAAIIRPLTCLLTTDDDDDDETLISRVLRDRKVACITPVPQVTANRMPPRPLPKYFTPISVHKLVNA